MPGLSRKESLDRLRAEPDYDVAILGGGVNGACLYDALCRAGYRALLVDKGDFACGTSQASGMLIWGGLLYLHNLELLSVFALSADRDRMIRQMPSRISPQLMRYLPSSDQGRSRLKVQAALWLYWMLGLGHRRVPRHEARFDELALIRPEIVKGSLTYQEGFLDASDARFVLRWIAPHQGAGHTALNYGAVSGAYLASDKRWHLDLTDSRSGDSYEARARVVVNCAGVWTDRVNAEFGVQSPFRHALSKGVYLGLRRPSEHDSSLVFELNEHEDVITYVPWGPISLWGPTETLLADVSEGTAPDRDDVDYLLDHYSQRFRQPVGRDDVVSIRSGVRPLVVDRDFHADCYPLELSRRQEVVSDAGVPWISCYGGKLTGCTRMAAKVLKLVTRTVQPTGNGSIADDHWEDDLETAHFPGLPNAFPSAAWCAAHEQCLTLDDYLRRRTNIAQWVPRQGLGRHDEHAPLLKQFALQLSGGDGALASTLFEDHRRHVVETVDPLLDGHTITNDHGGRDVPAFH